MQTFQGSSWAEFKITVLAIAQLVIFIRIDHMLFSPSATEGDFGLAVGHSTEFKNWYSEEIGNLIFTLQKLKVHPHLLMKEKKRSSS